jgi:hypothetical protein
MFTERMTKYLAASAIRVIEVARASDGKRYVARAGYRVLNSPSDFISHAAGHGDTPTEAMAALDLNMRRE